MLKPRDTVSGDFFWVSNIGKNVITIAADATEHGVPGAFMSMLGIAFLNEVKEGCKEETLNSGEILDMLRDKIKVSLKQTGKQTEQKDGMDIAICIVNTESLRLQYSGAYNPLSTKCYLFVLA